MTDSTELGRVGSTTALVSVHPSAVHHSTTDLAYNIQRLVEVDSEADSPESFSTAFMSHVSLAADAYPIHFLPDLRTSRIQMTPHLSVHVDAESNTSVFEELLSQVLVSATGITTRRRTPRRTTPISTVATVRLRCNVTYAPAGTLQAGKPEVRALEASRLR